jgi:hypothetical protein
MTNIKNSYSFILLVHLFGDGVGGHQADCVLVCDQFMNNLNKFHENAKNSKLPTT